MQPIGDKAATIGPAIHEAHAYIVVWNRLMLAGKSELAEVY